MLVREDHVAGERSCWWERIMLVGKDHVGGKKIMLAEKDHVGGEGPCWFCKMMSNAKTCSWRYKNELFRKTGPCVSVRNINRSKLYVRSPPT